jgi:serine/threonine protein phosphatase PrpC
MVKLHACACAGTQETSVGVKTRTTFDLEIDAPLESSSSPPDYPLRHAMVSVGAKSDMGCIRENNEDKFDLLEPLLPHTLKERGRLYGVADGMGGHAAGQIASEIALNTFIHEYYFESTDDVDTALRRSAEAANDAVYEGSQVLPERQGMGTTLTVAVIREEELFVAHVGDSRAYLLRDGRLTQLTSDHSWVAEQVRQGGMSLEDALSSPFRNIILRSIGTGPSVEVDISHERVEVGDILLLCSDGLTAHIDEIDICSIAGRQEIERLGPSVAALRLVDLANQRGGRDNITVVLVSIESIVDRV